MAGYKINEPVAGYPLYQQLWGKKNPIALEIKTVRTSWVWWYMTVIPAFGRQMQEGCEFKASWAIY
jgi:hypothetical protein